MWGLADPSITVREAWAKWDEGNADEQEVNMVNGFVDAHSYGDRDSGESLIEEDRRNRGWVDDSPGESKCRFGGPLITRLVDS